MVERGESRPAVIATSVSAGLALLAVSLLGLFLADLDATRMPDANTLFSIAERLSGSFGIALLATFYATRTRVTGSPVTALHDCPLALTALCTAGALAALSLRGRPGWPGRGPCPPAADRATMVSAAK